MKSLATAPSNMREQLAQEAERKLKVLGARLIQAQHKEDGPAIRRIEKSTALMVSKRLCPHTDVAIGGMRIGSSTFTAVTCRTCKLSTKF